MSRLFSILAAWVFLLGPSGAWAARIKGTVIPKAVEPKKETLGYTVTQIAAPAKRFSEARQALAIFLKVKTSLPLPAPESHQTMRLQGLKLQPHVASCAVDAEVTLVNEESSPVTIMVGGAEFGTLNPAETKAYPCSAISNGKDSEVREIRVKEWPHIRGSIFVGEVGAVAVPDESGRFELRAPKGEYLLQIVGETGVVETKEVVVAKPDVDVGTINLDPNAPPPPPPPKKRRPPPPPAEEGEEIE